MSWTPPLGAPESDNVDPDGWLGRSALGLQVDSEVVVPLTSPQVCCPWVVRFEGGGGQTRPSSRVLGARGLRHSPRGAALGRIAARNSSLVTVVLLMPVDEGERCARRALASTRHERDDRRTLEMPAALVRWRVTAIGASS